MKTDEEIEALAKEKWGNVHRIGVLAFYEGYKLAQTELELKIKKLELENQELYNDCQSMAEQLAGDDW